MKKSNYLLLAATMAAVVTGCKDDPKKEQEAREKAKVGKVYNPKETGNGLETRDNQFHSSRNDNKKGTGQETGAPSDTSSVTTKDNISAN